MGAMLAETGCYGGTVKSGEVRRSHGWGWCLGWVEGVSRQGRRGGGVSVMAGKIATGECGGRGMLVPIPRCGNIKKCTFFSVVCLILNLENKNTTSSNTFSAGESMN